MESFLLQLFIFFTASAIAVPIAKKLGLGSVLGYLVAGIIIGPFGLSLIGDVESVMHMTEFGVVMMLFLIGLELKPSLLLEMRVPIIGMGSAQVLLTTLVISLISFIFLPWQQALSVGLILALSSTAIVTQTLKEKGLMNTLAGRSVFSVLLFQDLAVIPMLALMPLLAINANAETSHAETVLFDIAELPAYMQPFTIVLAILIVLFIGRYASRPIFRIVAKTHVRELFVAVSLAIVVGISLLMTVVGLSPALGTFLAGVVLADSEYRHELESDIGPFKGLLLGIFFISIGASLNFITVAKSMWIIIGITLGIVIIKFIILFIISQLFRMAKRDRTFFAIALAQGGEFAFVLFQFARTSGVFESEMVEIFITAVAISMFIAPILFKIYEVLADGKKVEEESVEMDNIDESGHKVILVGFGHLGMDIGRFLLSAGVKPVILDHDEANIEVLRKFGFEVYYGDATRLDLLESAGVAEAEILILTISDIEVSRNMVELISKHYPELKIVVSAKTRKDSYELMDLKVSQVRKESFGSALTMGQDVLKILGVGAYDAYRQMRIFRKHNEDMIPELHKRRHDGLDNYISAYQQQMANLEDQMRLDMEMDVEELDMAWTGNSPEQ